MKKLCKIAFHTIIILLLTACTSHTKFEKNIQNESYNSAKTWMYYAYYDGDYRYIGTQYRFFDNGKYTYSSGSSSDLNWHGFEDVSFEGEKNIGRWSYDENNNVFSLGIPEMTFYVTKFTSDSIALKGKGFEGKFLMTIK